jgi:methionine synthase, vitamin-B12 independent
MGPWSLATTLELPNGHRAVTDPGARRDLNQALEAGVAEAVAGLSARFGGAVQVVLEEPWVPALLQGSVPGTSDFDELAAVPQYEISKALDALAVGPAWLDCASLATLLQWEGPVAFDPLGLKGTAGFDAAAELLSVDKGVRLALSVDELMGAGDDAARGVAVRVARFVDMLGVGREVLQRIAVCAKDGGDALGLAGAIAVAREATDMLHRDAGDL